MINGKVPASRAGPPVPDPHSQNEGPTSTLLHHICETLVSRATGGSLQPRLATEWSISPEVDSACVCKLRAGVTFHDGSAFTAEDVVVSVERVKAESSGFKALHAAVENAEAIKLHTEPSGWPGRRRSTSRT